MNLAVKSENVTQADPVDNLRRRAAIYLLRKDMIQSFRVVWEEHFHMSALIQPRDNLRYVHTGLHIEIGKCGIRIIKTAGILFLKPVHHILHDKLRCKDLIRPLRWKYR